MASCSEKLSSLADCAECSSSKSGLPRRQTSDKKSSRRFSQRILQTLRPVLAKPTPAPTLRQSISDYVLGGKFFTKFVLWKLQGKHEYWRVLVYVSAGSHFDNLRSSFLTMCVLNVNPFFVVKIDGLNEIWKWHCFSFILPRVKLFWMTKREISWFDFLLVRPIMQWNQMLLR